MKFTVNAPIIEKIIEIPKILCSLSVHSENFFERASKSVVRGRVLEYRKRIETFSMKTFHRITRKLGGYWATLTEELAENAFNWHPLSAAPD